MFRLERELKTRTYRPRRYIRFPITDPKLREVWSADFRDRIVHHLLVSFLEPVWEKKFIFHSYACRMGKGPHQAVKIVQTAMNKGDCSSKYYLQADIQSFFTSINKNILYAIIKKHIKHPDILWLTRTIIFHEPAGNYISKGDYNLLEAVPAHKSLLGNPPNRGLPIGNLTSQFFANVYLNELDQFIKHKLKCRYYFRYMDDIVLLNQSKEILLDYRNKIAEFLNNRLMLKLHPKKLITQPVSFGLNFAGYIIRPDYLLIRCRTVKKLKNKLWHFNREILALNTVHPIRLWTPELQAKFQHIFASINSYFGLMRHANCLKLRRHLYKKHFGILKIYLLPANKHYEYFIWSND